jgi:hypothetical protein
LKAAGLEKKQQTWQDAGTAAQAGDSLQPNSDAVHSRLNGVAFEQG